VSQRLALLFSDSSLLVLPEGTDLGAAWREAEEHDGGAPDSSTAVVLLEIKIEARYEPEMRSRSA
jgi:hypothetical protein